VSPEPETYREEDEEEEYAPQSIFAAGWFRAVLVLTVLAIVVVVSLPYLLNWFEPAPLAPGPAEQASAPPPAAAPAPPAPPGPAAAAPARPAEAPVPAPQVARQKAPEPKPAAAAPKETADKAPAGKPARPAEPGPRAERAARSPASAALPAAEAKGQAGGRYWLQLGVFKAQPNAEALARTVREEGFPVEVTRVTRDQGGLPPGTYHLVRAGGFPDLAAAGKAREALQAKGHSSFITKAGAP
jgi:septal ring-binding cell division protein DamX